MEKLKLIKEENPDFKIGEIKIKSDFFVIAGPCSVEGREEIIETAKKVKEVGADMLRGGAFKPRTNPYSFQGLGKKGLEYLAEAREITGLPIVTEVMNVEDVELVARYVDVLQIGTRNMYNYSLLKKIGKIDKPIILKRGLSATLEEWLGAAEYILNEGNKKVILCERGIRTFEKYTRNTLDLMSIPIVKNESSLPIISDPSHGTGRRELIMPASKATKTLGGNGLIIEAHNNPENAISDKDQTISIEKLKEIIEEIKK